MEQREKTLVCVMGPTASGKSELALRLCAGFGGELLSFDSMQIYKRLDIGTAKPSVSERRGIVHRLIDICEPDTPFSAADFRREALKSIDETFSAGKLPVLCGGTGLYFDAVLGGSGSGELSADPEFREKLRAEAESKGNLYLHSLLSEKDPEAAAAIHPNNVKRVIRALEICEFSGMTKTEWDREARRSRLPCGCIKICLNYRSRALLSERIDRRTDKMISSGLIDEARALYDEGLLRPLGEGGATADAAIGYKELIPYFRGECTLEQAADEIKTAIRRYAKRQLTWFLRDPDTVFFYPDDYMSADGLYEKVSEYVKSRL